MKRTLTSEEIDAYANDGVLLIRNAVSTQWVERLDRIVDGFLSRPGRWTSDTGDQAGGGRALDERYLWRENSTVRRFVFESGVASLVGQAMQCKNLRFYYDHWFVKEPGKETATPWHQDAPYWPFKGRQIASLWLSLSEVDRLSSPLELVKGSHTWGKYYKPQRFVKTDPKNAWIEEAENADGEAVPDIDGNRDAYDIFCETMAPGDGLIFSAWTVHAAPSNRSRTRRAAVSTRWLGDDVRWFPHSAADPTVGQEAVCVQPGELATDDDRFPVIWSRRGTTSSSHRDE